jgi:hydroxymethylpyrimidine pyrophosphatase-like HAD family hydrolase
MEVKAVAKEITHHNKEDGVAAVLEKIRDFNFVIRPEI